MCICLEMCSFQGQFAGIHEVHGVSGLHISVSRRVDVGLENRELRIKGRDVDRGRGE